MLIVEREFGVVYCYIFQNRKVYVGQTVNLKIRVNQHFSSKNKSYFGKALKKYGKDKNRFFILEKAYSKNQLNSLEKKWIKILGSFGTSGYNLTSGGDGGESGENSPVARKVYCTNGISVWYYNTLTEAVLDKNGRITCVNGVCNGRHDFSGVDKLGNSYSWGYFTEVNDLFILNRHRALIIKRWFNRSDLHKYKASGENNARAKSVILVNFNMRFGTIAEAANYAGICRDVITQYLLGRSRNGGSSKDGIKFIWKLES